ncbi:hypothetical protein C1645_6267 [Glomus cerebriforme]|uniref:SH3 domain-containing protein n=1 Tax=Glomus cerebriforme TaxID=658196 RepID=A0A397S2R4_9GLOM|nr:hypothetical protein C1645_6267 [Glomus cerebriforme]
MIRQHNLSIDTEAAAKGQRVNKSSVQKNRNNDTDSDDNSLEGNDNNNHNNVDMEDDEELSSSPSIPDENIDFDLVYALHTFLATVEGQASVEKGDSLTLLDDSNSYWWLVKVLKNDEVGYIPAENIETPYERLARLNKHRNVNLSASYNNTEEDLNFVAQKSHNESKGPRGVKFTSPIYVVAEEDDYYDDDEEEEEEYFEDGEEVEDLEGEEEQDEERDEETSESILEQYEKDQVEIVDEPEEVESLNSQVREILSPNPTINQSNQKTECKLVKQNLMVVLNKWINK